MAQQRILITGVTGFVGSWLADELAASYPEAELYGTTRSESASATMTLPAKLNLLYCDMALTEEVSRVVAESRPDRVFHLAGVAAVVGNDARQIHEANVLATLNLLHAITAQTMPCHVLLVSSGYVYGSTHGRPAREGDTLHPAALYGKSKAEMEREAIAYLMSNPEAARFLHVTIARAFNHTGPRQRTDFVVPAFAKQIARIEAGMDYPLLRVGNLEARRDFLDVRDVVRAYRLLICEAESHSCAPPPRIVNVASGVSVTIQSLLDILTDLAAIPIAVETDPARMRASDLTESVGDCSYMKALTGWQPEIPITDTLRETLDWWRSSIKN